MVKEKGKAAVEACVPPELLFEVPEDVRHLPPDELDRLTCVFRRWFEAAAGPVQRRARGRIWLAFLLLRYGALRLGELLVMDDVTDIDAARSVVLVREPCPREVQLPEPVMVEIQRLLGEPMMYSLRGKVLRLDQGYLRRRFYERAPECGISRGHLSPRVLRQSRAIELLRGGVPLKLVQTILGQPSHGATGALLHFPEDDARRIVGDYLRKETRMRTSARNTFTGRVTGVKRDGLLVEVELATPTGLRIVAVITEESYGNLGLGQGAIVTASIKAPWVVLLRHAETTRAGVRNRFAGTVQRVNASAIASEVVVALPEGSLVCALTTSTGAADLAIAKGDEVDVLFNAFSVILTVE